MRVKVPASIEDATERLTGLESLLTATEWEKAAIVAAFVELPGQGFRTDLATSSQVESPQRFAARGIAGLKSKDTVRRYVEAWTVTAGLTPPVPGQRVDLPGIPFPATPTRENGETGGVTVERITANPAKVAEAIKASPAVAETAVEAAVAAHPQMAGRLVGRNAEASSAAAKEALHREGVRYEPLDTELRPEWQRAADTFRHGCTVGFGALADLRRAGKDTEADLLLESIRTTLGNYVHEWSPAPDDISSLLGGE